MVFQDKMLDFYKGDWMGVILYGLIRQTYIAFSMNASISSIIGYVDLRC